ncbi:hypothetical protein KEM56_005910 [Ascosphaera pollenicola]|nr:hypothetical protein KEM56_005910 [Ascosphaera pollenicola]
MVCVGRWVGNPANLASGKKLRCQNCQRPYQKENEEAHWATKRCQKIREGNYLWAAVYYVEPESDEAQPGGSVQVAGTPSGKSGDIKTLMNRCHSLKFVDSARLDRTCSWPMQKMKEPYYVETKYLQGPGE